MVLSDEIRRLANQIKARFNPSEIILFGSHAKGLVTARSDIDLCLIADVENKRQLVQDVLLELETDFDVDVVVYTPAEWNRYRDDLSTFASIIFRTGVSLQGSERGKNTV